MYKTLQRKLSEFIQPQSSGGVVLALAAGAALLVSNSRWSGAYERFLQMPGELRIGNDALVLSKPLLLWVKERGACSAPLGGVWRTADVCVCQCGRTAARHQCKPGYANGAAGAGSGQGDWRVFSRLVFDPLLRRATPHAKQLDSVFRRVRAVRGGVHDEPAHRLIGL